MYNTSSTVVHSHIDSLFCECIILYQTVIYPLRWRISSSVSKQSHHHRISISPESWNSSTTKVNSHSIWCNPVSSRVSRAPNVSDSSRTVSMTDKSSVIGGANISDHHIAMVRDNAIIKTEVYTCTRTSIAMVLLLTCWV